MVNAGCTNECPSKEVKRETLTFFPMCLLLAYIRTLAKAQLTNVATLSVVATVTEHFATLLADILVGNP